MLGIKANGIFLVHPPFPLWPLANNCIHPSLSFAAVCAAGTSADQRQHPTLDGGVSLSAVIGEGVWATGCSAKMVRYLPCDKSTSAAPARHCVFPSSLSNDSYNTYHIRTSRRLLEPAAPSSS